MVPLPADCVIGVDSARPPDVLWSSGLPHHTALTQAVGVHSGHRHHRRLRRPDPLGQG